MKPNLYTRNVLKTLSTDRVVRTKDAEGKEHKEITPGPKFGLRQVLRKTALVNVMHGVDGFRGEVGELIMGLRGFLLGFQMDDSMRENATEELGDCKYYLTVCSKFLKVRVPPAGRKQKLVKMTIAQGVLDLDMYSAQMADLKKKVYYGREMDLEALAGLTTECHRLVDALAGSMLDLSPGDLMEANIAKLTQTYPDGFFSQDAEGNRDRAKEMAAMNEAAQKPKAPKAAVPKAVAVGKPKTSDESLAKVKTAAKTVKKVTSEGAETPSA